MCQERSLDRMRTAGTTALAANGRNDRADRKVVFHICENRMPSVHGADAEHGRVSWWFPAVVS